MRDSTTPPPALLYAGANQTRVLDASARSRPAQRLSSPGSSDSVIQNNAASGLHEPVETPQQTINVLHVDDDAEFAALTETLLGRDDRLTVVSEVEPSAVIDRLQDGEERIDCIVSDYHMPHMDGLELFHRVRRIEPTMPFILFTTEWEGRLTDVSLPRGVTEVLPKGGVDQHEALIDRILAAVEVTTDGD